MAYDFRTVFFKMGFALPSGTPPPVQSIPLHFPFKYEALQPPGCQLLPDSLSLSLCFRECISISLLSSSLCLSSSYNFLLSVLSVCFGRFSFVRQGELNMVKAAGEERPRPAFGLAALDSSGVLSPFKFSRRFLFLFTL